jgi:hypothetical protein
VIAELQSGQKVTMTGLSPTNVSSSISINFGPTVNVATQTNSKTVGNRAEPIGDFPKIPTLMLGKNLANDPGVVDQSLNSRREMIARKRK